MTLELKNLYKFRKSNGVITSDNRLVDYKPQPPLENRKNNGIMGISNKSVISRKGKSSMRDYSKISDAELTKLVFRHYSNEELKKLSI